MQPILLYFRAGQTSPKQARADLPHAFTRAPQGRQCTGPDQTRGCVFAQSDSTAAVMFDARRQTWHPFPGLEGTWFGWWNDTPPAPEALAVDRQLPGHPVELAGRRWTIPVARRLHVEASNAATAPRVVEALPAGIQWDGRQFSRGPIVRRYQRLWELSEIVFDRWRDSDGGSIRLPEDSERLCCELLAVNYRLSPAEICALGMLEDDADQLWAILRCVIDVPTIVQWLQKKTTGAGASSSPGDPD